MTNYQETAQKILDDIKSDPEKLKRLVNGLMINPEGAGTRVCIEVYDLRSGGSRESLCDTTLLGQMVQKLGFYPDTQGLGGTCPIDTYHAKMFEHLGQLVQQMVSDSLQSTGSLEKTLEEKRDS
jgi:hypothetical protein